MNLIEIDKEAASKVTAWLTGQSFTNILLASVLAAVGYSVPVALEKVQTGYELINTENRADRQQIRDDNIRLVNLILQDREKEPLSEILPSSIESEKDK
jgi:hypothetical protein